VTARIGRLLDTVRAGRLTPSEFAYVRAGFFPDVAKAYQNQLESLGPQQKFVLLERRELGDDRVYTYEVTFASGARYVQVALAPDDRVASFSLRRVPQR